MTGETPAPANVATATRAQFAADVRYYLLLDPRQLPSRYLYDDLGSILFEAICRLPWYGLTRAEMGLLRTHAREILRDATSTIVELGSGSGEKLSALIAAAGEPSLDLHLVDVSPSALEEATLRLGVFHGLRVSAHQTTYEAGLEEFAAAPRDAGGALVVFLGSNIGNFDPPGREAFLRLVRRAMRTGDRLLLGADLIKPSHDLRLAYDDPLGITAAFNRNLLVRINRELNANFDLGGFAHHIRWNAAESRVEMHLVSARAQRIRIDAADFEFSMARNESIWTESSYKFDPGKVAEIVEQCGFHVGAQWIDRGAGFALTCADAV